MDEDEMTERITGLLEQGIRAAIEQRDAGAFRAAAIAAYRLRLGPGPSPPDGEVALHVFPSDVEQVVGLSLKVSETDREKAASLFKGALEQVLARLSVLREGHPAPGPKKTSWRIWKR